MDPTLEGYEKGQLTELGAVNVMTGVYTGRSPKDKYIVMDANSKDTVWWTSDEFKNDNHPMSESVWATVKNLAMKELSNKKLYVVDAFCGANADTRMNVRFIVEVAWQAHFIKNMFIVPSEEELKTFEPDFVVYNASKAAVENYKELGLVSSTCQYHHPYVCGLAAVAERLRNLTHCSWCESVTIPFSVYCNPRYMVILIEEDITEIETLYLSPLPSSILFGKIGINCIYVLHIIYNLSFACLRHAVS